MRRQPQGLRIDEAAKHVGEEWRLRYSNARVRIDAIETVQEPTLGYHRAGGRNVRKVRVTMLHPETGKEHAAYGEPWRRVRAQELVQPWAEYVIQEEERKGRRDAAQVASMRLGRAFTEANVNVDFLSWRDRGSIEVVLSTTEANFLADLLDSLAVLGKDEEG